MQTNFDQQGTCSSYQGATGYSPEYVSAGNSYSVQQKAAIATPVYQTVWKNKLSTEIKTNLRIFFAVSGFFYALWGIVVISVQIAIIINTFSTYYHGLWCGSLLVIAGATMMIIAARSHYPLMRLLPLYGFNLGFSTVALIFSAINYSLTRQCDSLYCDKSLANQLQLSLIVTFSVALIHTIVNLIFVSREHRRTVALANAMFVNQ
ncbi:unnamed protein product [Adineta ricciae]|uniref:MARVEL domain-containing protein n=1 Tax=Adineta ricciae TaxID=249248 RepID=A0A813RBZ8_ADIRI|nr:unnamed protein product [Adineta ricciae]